MKSKLNKSKSFKKFNHRNKKFKEEQPQTRKGKRKAERQNKKMVRMNNYMIKVNANKEYHKNKNKFKNKGFNDKQRNPQDDNVSKNVSRIESNLKEPLLDNLDVSLDKGKREKKVGREKLPVKNAYCGTKKSEKLLTDTVTQVNINEKAKLRKLEKQMKQNRKKNLLDDNKEEDKLIKELEKQLGLDKRKSKSLPNSFTSSGLDYILDICNEDRKQSVIEAEKNLLQSDLHFHDDLAMIKGERKKSGKEQKKKESGKKNVFDVENLKFDSRDTDEDSSDLEESINDLAERNSSECTDDSDDYDEESDDYSDSNIPLKSSKNSKKSYELSNSFSGDEKKSSEDSADESNDTDLDVLVKDLKKRKKTNDIAKGGKKKKVTFSEDREVDSEQGATVAEPEGKSKKSKAQTWVQSYDCNLSDAGTELCEVKVLEGSDQQCWEDIYGRKRDKAGNIIAEKRVTESKYIPPHLRHQNDDVDSKKKEVLERLKRQLKGLVNRLAENNMHSIASQIEELYMKNSRNDMNETLTILFMEAVVSNVITPERLVMEHAMLTTILHANVGTEVGAHILQQFVKRFYYLLNERSDISDKKMDNLLLFISHLYTFKLFDAALLYDILGRLCERFGEKEVELLLVVLRSVGFAMRKDSPLSLKELVLRVQQLSAGADSLRQNSRVGFMLEVLLTIKNNNMSKLPQYDPALSEHLRKVLKPMIRKGNYVTQLKITLDDLLKAEERGRWWIVGSAWSGPAPQGVNELDQQSFKPDELSAELLLLAKKLRINTESRKNIFCILMSAEDYSDAFEKLVKLGLKGHMMREVVHILLHCLLSEKDYNPYYAFVANRFCQADRKHQMEFQCALWDKFKEVENLKSFQITNLAKFMAFLFLEATLAISVLKVIQFVDMTRSTVRLVRQALLTILLHREEAEVMRVFTRITRSAKLSLFRESLRLFLHHFLLKNMEQHTPDFDLLKTRIDVVDTILQVTR